MKEKNMLKIFYWAVLLNPLCIVTGLIGLRTFAKLCQMGGLRRRLPVIVICGLLLLVWFLVWTICYFKKKKAGKIKIDEKSKRMVWILLIELITIVSMTTFYGMKVVRSAQGYNGHLAWKLEEWKSKKEVLLKHQNIYETGLSGVLDDMKEELSLPDMLYISDTFELEFETDGTIRKMDAFLYGKDKNGDMRSYLLSYNENQGQKMTVWLDGYTDGTCEAEKKLSYLTKWLDKVPLRTLAEKWAQQNAQTAYLGAEYDGKKLVIDVPGEDDIEPVIYENPWAGQSEEETTAQQKQIGTCIAESSDGSLTYYLDDQNGWRLVVVDAAAGSRWYALQATKDGGGNWNTINEDPFLGNDGVAVNIAFTDENNGIIEIGSASGENTKKYVTKDGGKKFSII